MGETQELLSSIENGERLEKEPLYFSRGYAEGPAGEDIGNSYVEIDLGGQHLYLYIDGRKSWKVIWCPEMWQEAMRPRRACTDSPIRRETRR